MRSTIATATFAALAAGSVGVGALDNIPNMVGSDTLDALTVQVINSCKAGGECLGLNYLGTGSGNGQTAMTNGTQSVAPMSRALNSGICSNAGRTTAEGIVVAMDALSVAGNPANTCASIDYTGTTAGATSNDWRNVLRTIYTGMPTGQNNILQRDCNSAARATLLNDWDAIFRDACTGKTCNTDSHPSAGTAASPPAQRYDVNNAIVEPGLRHAFRRDEESGTTDVFLTLLSLGTISFAQNGPTGTTPALTTAQNNVFRALANSAFCNIRRPTDTNGPVTVPAVGANPASVIPETTNMGAIPAPPAGQGAFPGWDHDGNAGTPPQWRALTVDRLFPEFQDQDPVRRRCVGVNTTAAVLPNEQVCSADGKLGVVLPINPPPLATTAEVYPTTACASGDFEFGPDVTRPNGQGLRCPNGDEAVGAPAQCRLPRAAGGSFNCLNRGGSWGLGLDGVTLVFTPGGSPAVIDGETPGETVGRPDIDGRAYNLILRDAAGNPRTIGRPDPASVTNPLIQAPIVGAFYRIHSTRSLLLPPNSGTATCQKADATQQLGCLVLSSPCSLSYAGAEAVALNPGTTDVFVNGVEGTTTNVQNLVTGGTPVYPFSRKLYINSLRGFHNPILEGSSTIATDGETDLVRHFVSDIPGTIVPSNFGYVALPGAAFCEDFNENGACAPVAAPNNNGCTTSGTRTTCTNANSNACAAATTVAGIPDNAGFCGDGIVQTGEACDDGNLITDTAPAATDPTNDICSVNCTTTN